jgi:hypothetical protein
MARQIRIITGTVTVQAELNETKTANAVWQALPFSSKANTWGDEIYFNMKVKIGEENGKEVVNIGDLGYWPPGNAFCIFFGPTPMSSAGEIRAASAVNVFGKLTSNPEELKKVKSGVKVIVEKI